MNKKAELGISTLILLAAMILVSAVLFYVLTSSVNDVTQDAKKVGTEVRKNIGTAMYVIQLYAEDGSSDNDVDYFYMEVKPPYASDEIKLNDTLLMFAIPNISREYEYDSTINCSLKDASNSSSIYNSTNDNNFGIAYVNGAATYSDTIVEGELVRLCWKSPGSVEKDKKIIATFFSKVGYTARIETTYTDLITEKTTYFFP